MRTLVTGGAGFIGSHLVDRLLADGHQVTVIDDLSSGSLLNLEAARRVNLNRPGALRFVRLELDDPQLEQVVARARPEVVHHLAAQMDVRVSVADPVADARTNVLGTVAVLSAAARAGARKVVFTSSGGTIYGSPRHQPVSERASLDPLSPYAAAKAAAEPYLRAFHGLAGLDFTVLALGNVYGPRQSPHGEAGVVAIFGGALVGGQPTMIYGDGSSIRDYVYVDDVVQACVHFAGTPASGRRLNIASGVGTTVRDLHTQIAAALGRPDAPAFSAPRPGELHAITLDVTAARQVGWTPETPLPEGLARTLEWVSARR